MSANAVVKETVRNILLESTRSWATTSSTALAALAERIVTEAIPLVEMVTCTARRSKPPVSSPPRQSTRSQRLPRSETLKQRQGALSR